MITLFGQIKLHPIHAIKGQSDKNIWVKIGDWCTYGRVPLGLAAATSIFLGFNYLAICLVIGFVLLDILDGRFSQIGGQSDSASRRAADGIIDKMSVHLCALAVCFTVPEVIYIWLILLARDIMQGTVSMSVVKTGFVPAGAWWHRFASLAIAVWGVSVLATGGISLALAIVAIVVGWASLADYTFQCFQHLSTVKEARKNTVYSDA